jgi:hypothetical protein
MGMCVQAMQYVKIHQAVLDVFVTQGLSSQALRDVEVNNSQLDRQ